MARIFGGNGEREHGEGKLWRRIVHCGGASVDEIHVSMIFASISILGYPKIDRSGNDGGGYNFEAFRCCG